MGGNRPCFVWLTSEQKSKHLRTEQSVWAMEDLNL